MAERSVDVDDVRRRQCHGAICENVDSSRKFERGAAKLWGAVKDDGAPFREKENTHVSTHLKKADKYVHGKKSGRTLQKKKRYYNKKRGSF